MQEDGGKKGVNPALEKHWEKIVLGVVVVLAVIFLGSKFSGGGNAAPKSVDAAEADFKRKIDAQNPKIDGPKAIPEPKVPPPAIANRAPDWAIGERTKHSFVVSGPVIEVRTYKFPDVSLGSPTANPDGVKIAWSVTKFDKEQATPKKGEPIPVMPPYLYKVERREKGGTWMVLQEAMKTDKENFSPDYTDSDIKPKTDYEYRVTVRTQDKAVIKDIPTGLNKMASAPVSVTTHGIWRFEFNQFTAGDRDAEPPILPTVWVKIIKYDPVAGEVSWTRIHKEGKPLGFDENGTSVHGTYSDRLKRQLPIDFNCGGKIEKIEFAKEIDYEFQVCNVKQGPMGPDCSGPEKIKAKYKVNEVTYTDEDGKKQTFRSEPVGRNADKLCPNHGGAPPPKELSADEKKAQRETEASKMLDEAETLWHSEKAGDKKKAQDIYKKLLASFSDTDAVKPRKSDISDRSKKKIE
ncbi:MAG TPA: hypothetical protein VFC86_12370 [Planctomycetota bacterium]|nr:hypothetical protein [Planctomycetota bacterium]